MKINLFQFKKKFIIRKKINISLIIIVINLLLTL